MARETTVEVDIEVSTKYTEKVKKAEERLKKVNKVASKMSTPKKPLTEMEKYQQSIDRTNKLLQKMEKFIAMGHVRGNPDGCVLEGLPIMVKKAPVIPAGINSQSIVHIGLAEGKAVCQAGGVFHGAQQIQLAVFQHGIAVFPAVYNIFVLPVRGVADAAQIGYQIAPHLSAGRIFHEHMLIGTANADSARRGDGCRQEQGQQERQGQQYSHSSPHGKASFM